MKLIIDLPEEDFGWNGKLNICRCSFERLIQIVSDGKPLPEHHGRLKDVDWIDENCNHHYSERDGSWCYTWRDIDNAPTIIEGSESE